MAQGGAGAKAVKTVRDKHRHALNILKTEFGYHQLWKQDGGFSASAFAPRLPGLK